MSSKAARQNSVLFVVCLIIFCVFAAIGLGICFGSLVPSINKAKGYDEGECTVSKSVILADCYSSECADYNDQIWWYGYWGPSYFFVYVGGGTDSSYNNGDDDGDDDDDDGDDDGDDDDDDDGESGDGDSGGGDDSGGGGGDSGLLLKDSFKSTTGGQSFGQEIKSVSRILRSKSSAIKSKKYSDKFLKELTANSTSSDSSNSESEWNSSDNAQCGYNYCAQGVNYVTLVTSDGTTYQTSISGLWSSDEGWVSSYLNNFLVGSTYTCYYQEEQPANVMWFPPPKYNNTSLVMTIITFSLGFISLVAAIIYGIKYCIIKRQEHHHHHDYKPISHHSKHEDNYRIVYQPPPVENQPTGNYYQYSYGVPYNPSETPKIINH